MNKDLMMKAAIQFKGVWPDEEETHLYRFHRGRFVTGMVGGTADVICTREQFKDFVESLFEGAPEGTTHYSPEDKSNHQSWWKLVGDEMLCICEAGGVHTWDCDHFGKTLQLIPRPVKKFEPQTYKTMKKLREMYPNGMYTDNSKAVFKRFKELLKNDIRNTDEAHHDNLSYCGLDGYVGLALAQYSMEKSYGKRADYITNKEFFEITLNEKMIVGDTPEQLKEGVKPTPYMPKVGEECEVSVDGGLRWYKFVKTDNRNLIFDECWGEISDELYPEFRPLRTERELFIDWAIDDYLNQVGSDAVNAKWFGRVFGAMYDAGYTKGGVK